MQRKTYNCIWIQMEIQRRFIMRLMPLIHDQFSQENASLTNQRSQGQSLYRVPFMGMQFNQENSSLANQGRRSITSHLHQIEPYVPLIEVSQQQSNKYVQLIYCGLAEYRPSNIHMLQQLRGLEHAPSKRGVVGSNPTWSTICVPYKGFG